MGRRLATLVQLAVLVVVWVVGTFSVQSALQRHRSRGYDQRPAAALAGWPARSQKDSPKGPKSAAAGNPAPAPTLLASPAAAAASPAEGGPKMAGETEASLVTDTHHAAPGAPTHVLAPLQGSGVSTASGESEIPATRTGAATSDGCSNGAVLDDGFGVVVAPVAPWAAFANGSIESSDGQEGGPRLFRLVGAGLCAAKESCQHDSVCAGFLWQPGEQLAHLVRRAVTLPPGSGGGGGSSSSSSLSERSDGNPRRRALLGRAPQAMKRVADSAAEQARRRAERRRERATGRAPRIQREEAALLGGSSGGGSPILYLYMKVSFTPRIRRATLGVSEVLSADCACRAHQNPSCAFACGACGALVGVGRHVGPAALPIRPEVDGVHARRTSKAVHCATFRNNLRPSQNSTGLISLFLCQAPVSGARDDCVASSFVRSLCGCPSFAPASALLHYPETCGTLDTMVSARCPPQMPRTTISSARSP